MFVSEIDWIIDWKNICKIWMDNSKHDKHKIWAWWKKESHKTKGYISWDQGNKINSRLRLFMGRHDDTAKARVSRIEKLPFGETTEIGDSGENVTLQNSMKMLSNRWQGIIQCQENFVLIKAMNKNWNHDFHRWAKQENRPNTVWENFRSKKNHLGVFN